MKRSTLVGGVGGIAFAILTLLAFVIGNPLGGNYSASDARSYVGSGHRAAAFIAVYLGLIGVFGLICLLARLREAVISDDGDFPLTIFWGTGLAAAVALAVGWCVALSPPIASAYAVSGFSIRPEEAYAISQAGGTAIYSASGILLGITLIVLGLSARASLPAWFRWVTLIFGVIALASMAFFPWFVLLIWGIVAGIWLLVSGRTADSTATAARRV